MSSFHKTESRPYDIATEIPMDVIDAQVPFVNAFAYEQRRNEIRIKVADLLNQGMKVFAWSYPKNPHYNGGKNDKKKRYIRSREEI
ncbi:MAG: hypothetical protein RL023_614 [Candidatus Parcubacteria bacterium]